MLHPSSYPSHRLSVAPMMDRTDRHFRYFIRIISKRVLLYTEMITTGALIHGDRERYLQYNPAENPLAIQLGGSVPSDLKICANMAENYGYDEVNLNVGCPSDRVQSAKFGACLMNEPELVAECINEMQTNISIPVTVKCRIGVDDNDSYQHLTQFIDIVSKASCSTFIIHARKAWLTGLSPKENREVPPLHYETVHQLKRDYPHLTIIINGGFLELDEVEEQLQLTDGVMIGRAAYQNPYLLAEADKRIFSGQGEFPTRIEILETLIPYIENELKKGTRLSHISRHILGLFQKQKGARLFRRHLSENAYQKEAGIEVIKKAMRLLG